MINYIINKILPKEKICRMFGHKFIHIYISGTIKKKKIQFIGAYCNRCNFGFNDLLDFVMNKLDNCDTCSYNPDYYNHD